MTARLTQLTDELAGIERNRENMREILEGLDAREREILEEIAPLICPLGVGDRWRYEWLILEDVWRMQTWEVVSIEAYKGEQGYGYGLSLTRVLASGELGSTACYMSALAGCVPRSENAVRASEVGIREADGNYTWYPADALPQPVGVDTQTPTSVL